MAGTTDIDPQSFNCQDFDFSLLQNPHLTLAEQPAPGLSREFFQATDAQHPLNLPNNVTGDDGLVFTEELLELHRNVWSLSDAEVFSQMEHMDFMQTGDDKWKVWVRRMMACIGSSESLSSGEAWNW